VVRGAADDIAVSKRKDSLRETVELFVWPVRENLTGRTEELEDWRGLSMRDIGSAFTEADGVHLVNRAAEAPRPDGACLPMALPHLMRG
jgi:hypothetical protein